MSRLCRSLPDKRSYIKYFNGKKLTFMGYPCVIGGYSHTSYFLYVKKNRSVLNDNIEYYCEDMSSFVTNLKLHNSYRSKFLKIVNKNFIGYNYVIWFYFDNIECFYGSQKEEFKLMLD